MVLVDRADRMDRAISARIQQLELGVVECAVVPGAVLFGWASLVTVLPMMWLAVSRDAAFFVIVTGEPLSRASRPVVHPRC